MCHPGLHTMAGRDRGRKETARGGSRGGDDKRRGISQGEETRAQSLKGQRDGKCPADPMKRQDAYGD